MSFYERSAYVQPGEGAAPAAMAASFTAEKPGMRGPLAGSTMQSEFRARPTVIASPRRMPVTCEWSSSKQPRRAEKGDSNVSIRELHDSCGFHEDGDLLPVFMPIAAY